MLKAFSCPLIKFGQRTIDWIVQSGSKLLCLFRIRSFSNLIFLGPPENAITKIAAKLGKPGKSIDAAAALAEITGEVEKSVPPLKLLKEASQVAVTEISIAYAIDRTRMGIGIRLQEANDLGAVRIDGIGFLITVSAGQQQSSVPVMPD